MMFDAATVVTSQADNVLHKDRVNYVTLKEDSHKYYKIETGLMFSPMKLEFNYIRNSELEDLKMLYSRNVEQPLSSNCENQIESPSTVTIKAANGSREFENERIYIKLESTFGCHVTIKAIFPNQNKSDFVTRATEDENDREDSSSSEDPDARPLIEIKAEAE